MRSEGDQTLARVYFRDYTVAMIVAKKVFFSIIIASVE